MDVHMHTPGFVHVYRSTCPSYRLCPADSDLSEACFQQTPMGFADDSSLMLANGTMIKLTSTFVSEGAPPAGSRPNRSSTKSLILDAASLIAGS